ncbi:hypothetical protein GGR56DRAFT_633514 [Xylariaceae sp. FL0804]|nr:hypothetical protein GGR56DRAFT_633514 [Xylariaceae sp. FL0804]
MTKKRLYGKKETPCSPCSCQPSPAVQTRPASLARWPYNLVGTITLKLFFRPPLDMSRQQQQLPFFFARLRRRALFVGNPTYSLAQEETWNTTSRPPILSPRLRRLCASRQLRRWLCVLVGVGDRLSSPFSSPLSGLGRRSSSFFFRQSSPTEPFVVGIRPRATPSRSKKSKKKHTSRSPHFGRNLRRLHSPYRQLRRWRHSYRWTILGRFLSSWGCIDSLALLRRRESSYLAACSSRGHHHHHHPGKGRIRRRRRSRRFGSHTVRVGRLCKHQPQQSRLF